MTPTEAEPAGSAGHKRCNADVSRSGGMRPDGVTLVHVFFRASGAVVAVPVALSCLLACSSTPSAGASPYRSPTAPPATAPASADPLTPPDPTLVAALGAPTAAVEVPIEQTTGLESVPWAYITDDPAGPDITLIAGDGGGCNHPAGIAVVATTTTVTLVVLTRHDQAAGTNCPANLESHAYTIALASPLGSRKLLHAPTSDGGLPAGL